MNDAPTVGPRGCPRHKTNRYGEIHVCERKRDHLGLHRDLDGFLWADEALAVGRHIVVAVIRYDGLNRDLVGGFLGQPVRVADGLASDDFYPLTVRIGRHEHLLFPSDHLIRLEDGTVRRLSENDYHEHWRANNVEH